MVFFDFLKPKVMLGYSTMDIPLRNRSRVALEQDRDLKKAAVWSSGLEGRIEIPSDGRARLYVEDRDEGGARKIRVFNIFDNVRIDRRGREHVYTTVYEQRQEPLETGERKMSLLTVEQGTSGHFNILDATITNHGKG
ncbi:MAG TPA: hypothetical protein VEW42_02660 [Candidatus Eisenbacteria bacterium]|nr:hypothetical protein [Candidatus Eisenbacteria bacterium]